MEKYWLLKYCKFEIFCNNFISRIALKDIFAMLKFCDYGMILTPTSVNDIIVIPGFTKLCIHAIISEFTLIGVSSSGCQWLVMSHYCGTVKPV